MHNVFEALGEMDQGRITEVREGGGFCWIDLQVSDSTGKDLKETLGITDHARGPLLDFDPNTPPSRKFHVDEKHVVFAATCFLGSGVDGREKQRVDAVEVHVLVSGEFILTLHQQKVSLPKVLPTSVPEHRSEQYAVYVVLDAMASTGFDALHDAEMTLEGLQTMSTTMGSSRLRLATLQATNADLSTMRRRIGPQRGIFERISGEISRIEGLESDSDSYFERVYDQLNRLLDAIDAAEDAMAKLIDLRLNETMYWLTVIATIFLPLTFLVGFFGMNFGWMVNRVDTLEAFIVLGVILPAIVGALTWMLVRRRGAPVQPDPDAVQQLIAALRRRKA